MKVMVKLDKGAKVPTKAYGTDAGFDLHTPVKSVVGACDSLVIDTGVHMVIPKGYCGLLVSKSGLNVKHDITTTGLIDADYTGSIKVKVINHGPNPYKFQPGDKVSQIIILPVLDVELNVTDELPDTDRGENGFGSSGRA